MCLPVLRVSVVERHKVKRGGSLRTPVYVTAERANAAGEGLVFEADLAAGGRDESHWILQGVCLLLNAE